MSALVRSNIFPTFFFASGGDREMPTEARQLVTFLVGPLMAAALAAVSVAVIVLSSLTMFPDVERACSAVGLTDPQCVASARAAGVTTLAAFTLVIAGTFILGNRAAAKPELSVPPLIMILLLIFCFALILAHLISREMQPVYVSRTDQLRHFSNFISLENLLWPLLLQLFLLERDWSLRSTLAAALMLIVTLTIFRAANLSILIWGFVLPLAFSLWDAHRAGWTYIAFRDAGIRVLLVALIGSAFVWDGLADTQSRAAQASTIAFTSRSTMNTLAEAPMSTLALFERRLASPLYQAALVAHLSETTALPTIADELRRKLRLSDRPNLNEFTYDIIYPGGAGVGETTSLFYGEGAAYFGKVWAIWALGAPLLFVLAWFILSRMRVEASALLSIQLWRSSFSGLVTLLPALLLQIWALLVMTGFVRLASPVGLKGSITSRVATGLLLITVLVTAVAQFWVTIDQVNRNTLVRLSFATKSGCSFDAGTLAALPNRVNEVAVPGREIRSDLIWYSTFRVDLGAPYGETVKENLPQVTAAVSTFAKCQATDKQSLPATLVGVKTLSGRGFVPLSVVTLAAILLSALLLAQMLTGRTFFRTLPGTDRPAAPKATDSTTKMPSVSAAE
jgi:hypothetical protein